MAAKLGSNVVMVGKVSCWIFRIKCVTIVYSCWIFRIKNVTIVYSRSNKNTKLRIQKISIWDKMLLSDL